MSVKLEAGSTATTSFKLDGLEYPRGVYEPIYSDKFSDGSGGIDVSEVKIGLRHKYNREILQNPIPYSAWVNGSDTPYASLANLMATLASSVF